MNVTLISHASVLIEVNGLKILSDPWLMGTTFNDSWALLAPASPVDFSDIDYIYISHEHPDHFHFPSLKSIPEDIRKTISILYQNHASDRLEKALLALHFKEVIKMPLYKWFNHNGISLYCGSVGSMDSFLAVKDKSFTVLNLNDCVLNPKHYNYILKKIGKIDLLLTQFSFANWIGNNSDYYDEASRKITDIKTQVSILNPRYTVPFASFIYFCNRENFWMNIHANSPERLQKETIPTLEIMKPGDSINLNHPIFNTTNATQFWSSQKELLSPLIYPESLELTKILSAIQQSLSIFEKKIFFLKWILEDLNIYIDDLDISVYISFRHHRITHTQGKQANVRYTMCSQAAWYMFNFTWGGNTLMISGMFKDENIGKKHHAFFFWQNLINTEFISFSGFHSFKRSLQFLWSKRLEIYYKYI